MTEPRSPGAQPTDPRPSGLLARLAAAPSRREGAVWAFVALGMMLIGAVLIPSLLTVETDQVTLVRAYLGGSVLAFFGFLPLLRATHAVIGVRAVPAWAMLVAYLVLLVRPLALSLDVVSAPIAVLSNLPGLSPQLVPYLLLATTAVAAGFAAYAVLPLAQNAASIGRRVAVAAAVGLLFGLALYSFAPYIAPLAALGVAVALLIRAQPRA